MIRVVTALVVLALALSPRAGSARFVDCREAPRDVTPKVFLDSIGVQPMPPGPLVRQFGKGVHDRLRLRMESIVRDLADEGVVGCYYCETRRPASKGSFSFNVQEKLATEWAVLLEVWSRVDSTTNLEGEPTLHGEVEWVLFPLCLRQDLNWVNRGFYAKTWDASISSSPSALDTLLVSRRTLMGYTIVALALSELQAKEYQHAFALLLRARETLPPNEPNLDPDIGPQIEDLIQKVIQLAQSEGVVLAATVLGGP